MNHAFRWRLPLPKKPLSFPFPNWPDMVHNSQRQTTEYCATYLPTASFLSSSCKLPFSLWASWWIVVSDGPQNDCVIISTCTINVKSCDSMLDHLLHVTHAWFYSLDEYRWTISPSVQIGRDFPIFHVLFIRFLIAFVTQLLVKQDFLPADLFRTPGITRCPLPPIEATKNGLPRSHGGKTGMDNGRAGWTSDQRLWFKPKPEIQMQTLSDRDNDAYR